MVRYKNRYIVFELTWKDGRFDDSLNEAALLAAFRDSIQQNFGDYGLGSVLASFQVKHLNPVTNIVMVRCSREHYRKAWCSLTLITDIRHRVVRIRMLNLTGTSRLCVESAKEASAARLQGMKLSKTQQGLVEEAARRLEAVEA